MVFVAAAAAYIEGGKYVYARHLTSALPLHNPILFSDFAIFVSFLYAYPHVASPAGAKRDDVEHITYKSHRTLACRKPPHLISLRSVAQELRRHFTYICIFLFTHLQQDSF